MGEDAQVDEKVLSDTQKRAIRNYISGLALGFTLLIGLGAWGVTQMAAGAARDVAVAEVAHERTHLAEYRRQFREEVQALAAETRKALKAESAGVADAASRAGETAAGAKAALGKLNPRIAELEQVFERRVAEMSQAQLEKLAELRKEKFEGWKKNNDHWLNSLQAADRASERHAADIGALQTFFNQKTGFFLISMRNDETAAWRDEKVLLLRELVKNVKEARLLHPKRSAWFANLLNDIMVYMQRLKQPGMVRPARK